MGYAHVDTSVLYLYQRCLLFHVSDELGVGYLYFHSFLNDVVTHFNTMGFKNPIHVVLGVEKPSTGIALEVILDE